MEPQPILKPIRVPTTTTKLSFSAKPLDDKKIGVPLPICFEWRNAVESASLKNIRAGRFGPQRLALQAGDVSYKVLYRIDLSPSILETISTRPYGGTIDDHREVPTLEEALSKSTQIWVTFEEVASDDALKFYCCEVSTHSILTFPCPTLYLRHLS